VENAPESYVHHIMQGSSASKAKEPEMYAKLQELWLKHIEANPKSANIAANAAQFFAREDRERVEELFKKALELDPKNTHRREQLASFYMTVVPPARVPDAGNAAKALAQYEALLPELDERRRPRLLVEAGDAALL